MFKVGLSEHLLHTRYSPTALVSASYLTAVGSRVDSFWLPDHLSSLFPRSVMTPQYVGAARLAPKIDARLEPWTLLGHLATRNRLGRRRLGIGVTDASRRNPAVTAQAAATLHLLTRGRAILGIGTGARTSNEPYGVEWSKPVARFEEALATIRALWNSGGQLVTRESPFFPLRDAVFDLPPYRGKWPDIWIASHGPRMLRATGRYGDGWFPAAMAMRPKDYTAGLEKVRAAASDAGRDPMSITGAGLFFVMTGRSRGQVDEALGSHAMKAFALDISAELWARHGARHPLGDDFTGAQDIIPQTLDEHTVLSLTADVPPSLLKESLLTGTSGDVIEQVAEWRDHGVQYAVIFNVSPVQPNLRHGLAASLPLIRILGGLRNL
ncbi:photosystem I reaction center subunit VIII [Mycobacterium kyorinense]|uniref:Photosystem I reaction center subunit VIII n=1 Tax=Mycobacterium kyorinense TaxID=487514 RepID=A0A1A2ZM86_9MYCO|nr:LLM class flavin-dependent oxidoreductase [Mycobacterium kyorinense]OBI51714.1 photosystem I reaction center subunit VIII [Mycobacterium kyorinense]